MKKHKDSSNNVFEIKGMQGPSGMLYYLDYRISLGEEKEEKKSTEMMEEDFKKNLIRGLRTLI